MPPDPDGYPKADAMAHINRRTKDRSYNRRGLWARV